MDKLRLQNLPDLLRGALVVVLMLVVAFVMEASHAPTLSIDFDEQATVLATVDQATLSDDCPSDVGHGKETKSSGKCCSVACPFLATLPCPPAVNSPARSSKPVDCGRGRLLATILPVLQRPPIS